jgi:hypothetical protein
MDPDPLVRVTGASPAVRQGLWAGHAPPQGPDAHRLRARRQAVDDRGRLVHGIELNGFVQNHADPPRGEFGFDVAGQETERFVLLLQD